jgi:hypothetical protein
MSPEDLTKAEKIRAAYEQAARGIGEDAYLLRAVRDLVKDLKKNGESPERVVITIKTLCAMPLVPFAGHHDRFTKQDGTRSISETVIEAAIEEYFSASILNEVGSP